MSLTSFIEFPEVKEALQKSIPIIKTGLSSKDLKILPLSKDYGIVGTAFDYLLRFAIKKLKKRKCISDRWIAEKHSNILFLGSFLHKLADFSLLGKLYVRKLVQNIIKEELPPLHQRLEKEIRGCISQAVKSGELSSSKFSRTHEDYIRDVILTKLDQKLKDELNSKATGIFLFAKHYYDKFLEQDSFEVSDKLISAIVGLANLDLFYRIGSFQFLRYNYNYAPAPVVKELRMLYDVFLESPLWDKIAKAKCVVLNPSFKRSHLVGGADCDLVVDDTIFEIKVVKNYKKDTIFQLCGYFWLWKLGGFCKLSNDKKIKTPKIRKIGIYFARHGKMWEESIESLIPNPKLKKLLAYLTKVATSQKKLFSSNFFEKSSLIYTHD